MVLRPASPDDAEKFAAIAAMPEVWRRWGDAPVTEFLEEMQGDEVHLFAVEVDGQVAGMIQFAEETEPSYRSASIDIFLAPDFHGRGLGPDAIRTLARHLFEARGHHRITIDPAADNESAIAAYGKVGFRPVGVMRRYERIPADEWHDGLLMDLLREELT